MRPCNICISFWKRGYQKQRSYSSKGSTKVVFRAMFASQLVSYIPPVYTSTVRGAQYAAGAIPVTHHNSSLNHYETQNDDSHILAVSRLVNLHVRPQVKLNFLLANMLTPNRSGTEQWQLSHGKYTVIASTPHVLK